MRIATRARGPAAQWLLATAYWLLAAVSVYACNIPVFRYALERWPAEAYEVLVFHRGPLPPDQRAALDQLKKAVDANLPPNLEVTEVDLDKPLPPSVAELWKSLGDPQLPLLVARYPSGPVAGAVAFSAPLSAANVQALLDSPARRALAKRLLGGESAVWLLLKSGVGSADDAAAKLLATELKRLEKELELPPQDPDAGPMARPVADLPLRLAFSVLAVSRQDPAERAFTQMLVNSDKELAAERGPVVIPVFGRGRALCALKQKDLTPDTIGEIGGFLTGPCSCQAKDLNPGIDLLLSADWGALLEGRAIEEPALPGLVGLPSPDDARVAQSARLRPGAKPDEGEPPAGAVEAQASAPPGSALLGNILILAAIVLVLVAAATAVIKRKAAGKRT